MITSTENWPIRSPQILALPPTRSAKVTAVCLSLYGLPNLMQLLFRTHTFRTGFLLFLKKRPAMPNEISQVAS